MSTVQNLAMIRDPADAEDFFDPLPIVVTPRPWYSMALHMAASKLVLADELLKTARETDDRHEKRRLRDRAATLRARVNRDLMLAGEELPADFDAAAYLSRCALR